MTPSAVIHQGDALKVLPELPAGRFHCCVTSPPYFGLRDYGVPPTKWPAVRYRALPGAAETRVPAMTCCLGLEPTPEAYVGHLVLVFRAVWHVLRDDGTLWLNLGDSYASNGGHGDAVVAGNTHFKDRQVANRPRRDGQRVANGATRRRTAGVVKAKDLLGIPWRVAFALQADGWYLRQDVIWHKPNPMPESVVDRCTKAHEMIFLLSKSPRYYFDHRAIQEESVTGGRESGNGFPEGKGGEMRVDYVRRMGEARFDPGTDGLGGGDRKTGATTRRFGDNPAMRNRRSVWTVGTKPYGGDHYATFNTELVEPCVLAGCPEGGIVLDPFSGRATVGVLALSRGRAYEGIELHPKHAEKSQRRLSRVSHVVRHAPEGVVESPPEVNALL